MKLIYAIVEPHMAERVVNALCDMEGVPGVALSPVTCMDAARRSHNPDVNTRLELMLPDELVEPVLRVIEEKARTGREGDGSIFVLDIEKTLRIRSGERDES